jgi:hypothetical protein
LHFEVASQRPKVVDAIAQEARHKAIVTQRANDAPLCLARQRDLVLRQHSGLLGTQNVHHTAVLDRVQLLDPVTYGKSFGLPS